MTFSTNDGNIISFNNLSLGDNTFSLSGTVLPKNSSSNAISSIPITITGTISQDGNATVIGGTLGASGTAMGAISLNGSASTTISYGDNGVLANGNINLIGALPNQTQILNLIGNPLLTNLVSGAGDLLSASSALSITPEGGVTYQATASGRLAEFVQGVAAIAGLPVDLGSGPVKSLA